MVVTIPTYVRGFDDALGGGIPMGHTVLVAGTPGTMKSSLMLNLLHHNSNNKETNGIYVSVEEPKGSLQKTMDKIGIRDFNNENIFLTDLGDFRVIYPDADMEQNWLESIPKFIKVLKNDRPYEIVVIDSFSALCSLVPLTNPRKDLFYFFGNLKRLGITTFLIVEMSPGSDKYGSYTESFLSDGIIHLRFYDVSETDAQLRIKCVKMRHVKHSHSFFSLIFENDTFAITKVISE
jgi:circadian clock protein KaiC